jgi:hypothetical protein
MAVYFRGFEAGRALRCIGADRIGKAGGKRNVPPFAGGTRELS